MKKLILLIMLFSMPTFADNCRAKLESHQYGVLATFNGYGYTRREACMDAINSCQYEKQRMHHDRRYQTANCHIEDFRYPRPRPGNGSSCIFELKRRNGSLISRFNVRGPTQSQACNRARLRCHEELDYRQSRGRNPHAYCQRSYSH